MDESDVTGFTVDLSFNATLLEPLDEPKGQIENGIRTLPLNLPAVADEQNKLITLRFISGLGNDSLTALTLENLLPVGDTIALTKIDGEFRLTGLCDKGGKRLLNPNDEISLFSINPNPSGESFDLIYELIETGRTKIYMVDRAGRKTRMLYDGAGKPGINTIHVDTHEIPAGTYFIIMETPTSRHSQRMEIVK